MDHVTTRHLKTKAIVDYWPFDDDTLTRTALFLLDSDSEAINEYKYENLLQERWNIVY